MPQFRVLTHLGPHVDAVQSHSLCASDAGGSHTGPPVDELAVQPNLTGGQGTAALGSREEALSPSWPLTMFSLCAWKSRGTASACTPHAILSHCRPRDDVLAIQWEVTHCALKMPVEVKKTIDQQHFRKLIALEKAAAEGSLAEVPLNV